MMICYYCKSYCCCSSYSISSDPSCCYYLFLARCHLFCGAEESPELKDGVIGREDDDEEGEVFELIELEIG
jgi:hypothetical protein